MELLIRDPGVGSHDGWLTDAALSRPVTNASSLSRLKQEVGGQFLTCVLCAAFPLLRCVPTSTGRHAHVGTYQRCRPGLGLHLAAQLCHLSQVPPLLTTCFSPLPTLSQKLHSESELPWFRSELWWGACEMVPALVRSVSHS